MVRDITLLDGGMGAELSRRGLSQQKTIWSGFALIDGPEVVTEVHREFIDAGAEIIITNNYGVTPNLMEAEGLAGRTGEFTKLAVDCAQKGRDAAGQSGVRIAGSLPPLGTSYRPDLVQDNEYLLAGYREIAEALAPGVDLFLGETLSTAREARAVAEAVAPYGKPIWISWTLDKAANGNLRSGETLAQALDAVADFEVEAYLFNCCSVESIAAGLPILNGLTDKPIGAYANAFGRLPSDYVMGESKLGQRTDLDPEAYLHHVRDWYDLGARILGGCCGIGPDHIRAIGRDFRQAA